MTAVRSLLYLIPGSAGSGPSGNGEMARRSAFLERHAGEGTRVQVQATTGGPSTVESEADEALAAAVLRKEVCELEAREVDALIIGCFGDPGIQAVRASVPVTVVGPAEASLREAAGLRQAIGVVTVLDDVLPIIRRRIEAVELTDRVLSVRAIGVRVRALARDREGTVDRVAAHARIALEEGAEALVLGCMSMGFLRLDRELSAALDVPVVNPVLAALRAAEAASCEG